MDRLTKYLVDNAEELIGSPIRPSKEVLERPDAALYIWRKMGMSHELLAEKDQGFWNMYAPAAHLYPFDSEELKRVKPYLNKFYIELKSAQVTVGDDLWYLVRGVSSGNMGDEWYLYRNNESFGSVNIQSVQEVEYAADADAALINLVCHLLKDFPCVCELATGIVLPFGCKDKGVWGYAGKVTLLGAEEMNDFRKSIVGNYLTGNPTTQITPKW